MNTELLKKIADPLLNVLPNQLRETVLLRAFATQIPVLAFCRPSVVELTDEKVVIKIPLGRRTKNHLNSMYFGALAAGADCAGALIAMKHSQDAKSPDAKSVSLIFKDFHADFLKRAEGVTYFSCQDGAAIRGAVEEAARSGERVNLPVHVTATVPSKTGDEAVAKFVLTLSLKKKAAK